MENIMVQIEKTGVIPVVVINDVEDAEPLAQALCDGGTALCRGNIPYCGGGGKHQKDDRYISRYVDRRGYGTYDGAGRQGSSGRSKIYSKSWI